ncbi:lysyl-tRNA synthetase class 2 [Chitinophaga japonensis]|uniref:Lysyl-tRNA synthetase class 2 n=2 Tax=Chitinophaga japonensis TaxID=104662 RepID=A0A562TFW3_CHIJA|nr:lysyl-tRNA synthetase class 2 [Chitinophaga japonensis]
MRMQMPSSVVAHMSYDPAAATLRIVYVSGTVYDYKGVPPRVYDAMKKASSKGQYLNRHIKGKYDFVKVSG